MLSSLVRNAKARNLLEYFWISAVVTVFGIRIFLYLTGYPQLGGGSFHIAHMLWGGLLMATAHIVMLSFLNQGVKKFGAVIGGVGFGTFIDELGKFITHDNNYFFEPTVLILYLIFVGLFFLAKQIEIWFPLDRHEYLVNSLEMLKEVAVQDLDTKEKQEAIQYLEKASEDLELRAILLQTISKIEPIPPKQDTFVVRMTKKIDVTYRSLVRNTLFAKVIIIVFTLTSLDNFAILYLAGYNRATFVEWGVVISTIISLVYVVQGWFLFRRGKRLAAFGSLKLATLVSIFLVQLFLFYIEQLSAAVELVGSLISLQALQLLIQKEKSMKAGEALAHSKPPPHSSV
jgi:hypothetical protein